MTAVPNAAHQPCADEIAAVADATGHCPSSGAPSQKQGEFKATQCEHGRCAPPSLSLCTLSQHVQHESIAWPVQGTFSIDALKKEAENLMIPGEKWPDYIGARILRFKEEELKLKLERKEAEKQLERRKQRNSLSLSREAA